MLNVATTGLRSELISAPEFVFALLMYMYRTNPFDISRVARLLPSSLHRLRFSCQNHVFAMYIGLLLRN